MLIKTDKEALELIEYLHTVEVLTTDTETTGLHPFHGDRICGVAIKADDTSYYLPFRHGQGHNLSLSILQNSLKTVLSDPEKTYIGFNYKFDMSMYYVDGIPLPTKIEEVMAMAHLLNENERTTLTKAQKEEYKLNGWQTPGYGLKYLAGKYLRNNAANESDILIQKVIDQGFCKSEKEAKGLMWKLSPEDVAPYACEDTELTKELFDFYSPHLHVWSQYDIYRSTCELHLIVTKMEINGLTLDVNLINQYIKEAEVEILPAKERLERLAGYPINANSPKQVQAFIHESSANAETLDLIISESEDQDKVDAAKAILEYRGWSKVTSTYYLPYLTLKTEENKIHPNISMTGTVSRRFSSYSPNLQTIPRYSKVFKVKDVFIAPEGYKFAAFDYSQAELRLAAHYMEIYTEEYIKKLEEIYITGGTRQRKWTEKEYNRVNQKYEDTLSYLILNGADLHQVAADAINRPRYDGKQLNFMVQYGIGYDTLALKLRVERNLSVEILDGYHDRFPGYKIVQNVAMRQADNQGYIRTWNGNVCHFKDERDHYKASSRLIQGGVAEIMREAIVNVMRTVPGTVLYVLQVHDDNKFLIPDDENFESTCLQIKTIMEDFNQFRLPPKVDCKVGYNLGNMEDLRFG